MIRRLSLLAFVLAITLRAVPGAAQEDASADSAFARALLLRADSAFTAAGSELDTGVAGYWLRRVVLLAAAWGEPAIARRAALRIPANSAHYTLADVAAELARRGDLDGGLAIVRAYPDSSARDYALMGLADARARERRPEEVLLVVSHLRPSGRGAPLHASGRTLLEAGDTAGALILLRESRRVVAKHGDRGSAATLLAVEQARAGALDEALTGIDRPPFRVRDRVTVLAQAAALLAARGDARADSLFAQARRAADHELDAEDRHLLHESVDLAEQEVGRAPAPWTPTPSAVAGDAVPRVAGLKPPPSRESVTATLPRPPRWPSDAARQAAEQGGWGRASNALAEAARQDPARALPLALETLDILTRRLDLNPIPLSVPADSVRRMVDDALALAERVMPAGAARDSVRRELARLQVRVDWRGALETAAALSPGPRDEVSGWAAAVRIERLDLEGARAMADALPPGAARDTLLWRIGMRQLEGGDADEARQAFSRIGARGLRALGLASRGQALLRVHRRDEAAQALLAALDAFDLRQPYGTVLSVSAPSYAAHSLHDAQPDAVVATLLALGHRPALEAWAGTRPTAAEAGTAWLFLLEAVDQQLRAAGGSR